MRLMKKCLAAAVASASLAALAGNMCPDGIAYAVPLKDGKAPVIDGCLDDWDLSAAEPSWNAEQYADEQYAKIAFMYDDDFFYVGVDMGLYDHEYTNPNRPADRFWNGDVIQVRICTDPKLPHPLPRVETDAITAINLWKNSQTGEDHLFITAGPGWNRVMKDKPAGSAVKVVTKGTHCVMESRTPWNILGVPSGKCPFKPGEMMSACVDVKWSPGSDGHYTALIFDRDPGAFAFQNLGNWGRIAFSARGGLPPKPKTLEEIAKAAREVANAPRVTSTPIKVTIPKKGKLSVNIVRDDGWVVKELMGGELHDAGEVTAYWDGRDSLGFPCETGREYKWKAYLHDGLDWEYVGTVGVSGNPPYETPDKKGGWGADHGPAVDAACDDTGRYFVWHIAEGGRGIVKTGFDGEVIWRTSPFVAGGFCPFNCVCAENGKVWIVLEMNGVTQLIRLDAATGNYELFPDGRGSIPFPASKKKLDLPLRRDFALNSVGCAVKDGKVYVSDTMGDKVFVLDGNTGAVLGELAIAHPRGICLYGDGLLVAQANGDVSKLGFDGTKQKLFGGLELPHGIAVDASGAVYVSDHGSSHQVKRFVKGADGWKLAAAFGKKGGRPDAGTIEKENFRYPAGLAVDKTGTLLVPEMAAPKIVNLLEAETGRILRKYYGYTSYAPTTFPDCDDPREVYYSLAGPDCFARAHLKEGSVVGEPDACWDFEAVGSPVGSVVSTMNTPYVIRAANGKKYLVADGGPGFGCGGYGTDYKTDYGTWGRPMMRIDANDVLTPVACVWNTGREGDALLVWCDRNGDGEIGKDELDPLTGVGEEKYRWALQNGSMYVDDKGDCYITSQNQRIVRLRNRGWNAIGAPDWDVKGAEIAIPDVLPGAHVHSGWRFGFLGMRRDAEGNFYAAINCNYPYVTEEYSKYMHQGMGHTADMNAVFMTKYDKNGKLVWRTGRKAIGGAKPGEILHHWCYAGLVNDEYSVAASEWACFTFYTKDGFYVDRIFDTPGLKPADKVGPKGMGGEDFSGQIVYYPERDEVWAYNEGHVFKVLGFEKGRVKGEWRTEGKVRLETVDPLDFTGKKKAVGDVKFKVEGGKAVFTAHVTDDSPLVNVAGDIGAVFKGGDAVGFEVGPKDAAASLGTIPERNPQGRHIGFARVLAARLGGKDRVIAFKPFTNQEKRPLSYSTPAGGDSAFEFVGEVPGAEVVFKVDANGKGYTAQVTVPAEFLELDFAKGFAFEAEALLSGEGQRGLGTVERCYLNSPDSSETTMTDDVPTESRLYPKGWGDGADVK